MKRERKIVDGTPNKRLFWSIISDYNLNTAICELIDNALDIWLKNGKVTYLFIQIDLDWDRQIIRIEDCAGGVPENQHQVLISPGSSNNNPDENIIGLFGVGSKRAVVALAQDIKIYTRHEKDKSFQIDIDESWLADDTWEIPVYEVDELPENSTIIDLSRLRIRISEEDEMQLRTHLAETYALFLKRPNFEIILNNITVEPIEFDEWAYPPGFEPRCYITEIFTKDNKRVGVQLDAGLIRKKEPGKDDYGVYFYCNDRLICKEIKDREVGYVTKLAGVPHFDASLARVIVKLYGPAGLMPWNSSKSAINFGHHIFRGLQGFLIPVVADYSSLSRRFKGHWEEKVFCYSSGEMEYVDIHDASKVNRSYLPPLPRVRQHLIDNLKASNKQLLQDQPWTLGLLESIAAVDIIIRQKLETKNRIALLLLDSTFEIALKEFIVHTQNLNLGGRTLTQIFANRDEVIKVVTQKVTINQKNLRKIKHYYQLRNKLVHEKATVDITQTDVTNYLETIQRVLSLLFGLQF
jgi:histidine kinase/DNA gyrase B/HSP90-like ATPase